MIKFTKERILLLYQMMVEATGGTFGIRDETMLDSAIEAAYQTFDGVELFPTKLEKAARLGFGLVSNHPFIDGNKRIGIYVMLSFLEVNGIVLEFTDAEIEDMALGIAAGKYNYKDILESLNRKSSLVFHK
ncbi:type II toxin-antitoxin system death-on-curing family toxin [bacterium]|nr:type II toxin-antitoxin system death-on-curing family toxin [bacterium]